MARLTATVVFPTPPFPLATAMRFFTPGSVARAGACPGCGQCACGRCGGAWGAGESKRTSTLLTPETLLTAERMSFARLSRMGEGGIGKDTEMLPPATPISFTMRSVITSLRCTGSMTVRRAASNSDSLGAFCMKSFRAGVHTTDAVASARDSILDGTAQGGKRTDSARPSRIELLYELRNDRSGCTRLALQNHVRPAY